MGAADAGATKTMMAATATNATVVISISRCLRTARNDDTNTELLLNAGRVGDTAMRHRGGSVLDVAGCRREGRFAHRRTVGERYGGCCRYRSGPRSRPATRRK